MTDLRQELRLPWEELTWSGPPEGIIKNTTADIEPQEEIIGQDRAVKALRRGLAMKGVDTTSSWPETPARDAPLQS